MLRYVEEIGGRTSACICFYAKRNTGGINRKLNEIFYLLEVGGTGWNDEQVEMG